MSAPAKVPGEKFHTLIPYLVVERPEAFLDFLKQVFGAEVMVQTAGGAGGLHAEVRLGDSRLMAGGGEGVAAVPAGLHVYVSDADAVYRRALDAGASSLSEPADQEYGDREAAVKDFCGNLWYIAKYLRGQAIRPGFRTVTPYLHPRGAAELIEFLQHALGAEERKRVTAPEGTIRHAELLIGDSLVELGEAHAEFQPMPCLLLLHTDDVDAGYERAVAAGAASLEPPADMPYGDRRAAVKDPAGNSWYFTAPIQKTQLR